MALLIAHLGVQVGPPHATARLLVTAPTFWVGPSMRRDRFARLAPEVERIFRDGDAHHDLVID